MIFERVRKIISEQFDLDPELIREETTLDDVNADSLDVYDLAQTLESEFHVEFREEALEEIKNVGDIVKFIESN